MCAKPRVKTEHTIGILKNRFPYLKELRTIISCKKDLQQIIKHVTYAVVLHNLLINDPTPDEWKETDLDSDSDSSDDEEEEMDQEVPPGSVAGARRTQLLHYLMEKFHFVTR